jgi:hypothetical protein
MKRIMLLATVAALMAVMLVVSAAPAAFAHSEPCPGPQWNMLTSTDPGFQSSYDKDNDGLICYNITGAGLNLKDDHDHN